MRESNRPSFNPAKFSRIQIQKKFFFQILFFKKVSEKFSKILWVWKIILFYLDRFVIRTKWHLLQSDREIRLSESVLKGTLVSLCQPIRIADKCILSELKTADLDVFKSLLKFIFGAEIFWLQT